MTQVAQITRARFIVFLAALALFIIGFGLMFYAMVNIQNRRDALNDSNLAQEERWTIEGSLQWWERESTSFYYPIAAFLIVLGIAAILYVVLVHWR